MTSFIRRFNGGVLARVALLAAVGLLFAVTHVALELSAQFAERSLDAFLWKQQDTLRLFAAGNYVDRGRGRLLIYGPSEAREALLPEELRPGIPGLEPYQHSQSIGTLEDGLVVLDYIERAYGTTAIPDAIVLGITSRFIANLRSESSPLFRAIRKYSPHFTLDERTHPPVLVPRSRTETLQARIALLEVQPDRYRRGLFAIARHMATTVVPSTASDWRLKRPIVAAKYLEGKLTSDRRIKESLVEPGEFWPEIHAWDPQQTRTETIRQLRMLLAYTHRHGIQLYVVNLPELSWNRALYEPYRYASYLSIVREGLGAPAFLDLRNFLADEDFFDSSHTTWSGSKRVSRRVAAFIDAHRAGIARRAE